MTNKVSKSFLKDSHLIAELKLCSIRLIDNAKFPWIILIPKRKNITDISELNFKRSNVINERNCSLQQVNEKNI